MRKSKIKFVAGAILVSGLSCTLVACSVGSSGARDSGSRRSSGGSAAGRSSSSGGRASGGAGNDLDIDTLIGGNTNAAGGTVVPCTTGDDCVCPTLSVAVIGTPGRWGATAGADSDTAFQDWLNSSSAGTARVDNYTTKPALTPDFLKAYDVIVLAGLGDNSDTGPWWSFSAAEIAAFEDWVENRPGGVISLSGYSGSGDEVLAKNALLAFSGISYNQDQATPPCANADLNNSQMCWCADGSLGTISNWNRTDPVIQNISLGVNLIGVAKGRSINAPADAHVAASTTNGSQTVNFVVGKVVGQGRVLVYSDEWITYTSQWNGEGNPNSTNAGCQGYLPQDKFETAQFWYDMIRWTQPNATCFKIVDESKPVIPW